MKSEADVFDLLKATMAEIYVGRAFTIEGERLSPAQAFDPFGALPLFAARAARRFRLVHPLGLKLERCAKCGMAAPETTTLCVGGCPLRDGEKGVGALFLFDLMEADPSHLLPVRVHIKPYRVALFQALFFVYDAAQEMVLASPQPRAVPIDALAEDLALELDPVLQAQVEQMRAAGAAPGPLTPGLRRDLALGLGQA